MRLVKAVTIVAVLNAASAAPFTAHAQSSRVTVPDTPAGTILRAWLDAFNSDSLSLDAYYRRYEPDRIGPSAFGMQRQTGGFDLVAVDGNWPRQIEAKLRERSTSRFAHVVISTPSDGSTKVNSFRLLSLGANGDIARIDAAGRTRVIDGARAMLDEWYVFPSVAKQAGDSMRARLKRGAYDSYTSGAGFAVRLHDELRDIAHDKHMSIAYSASAMPAPPSGGPPSPSAIAQQQAQADANNCGFVKVEVLPGNIGYLKFNGFANPGLCGPTASAAMNFVAATRALIVDLRDNTGGSPAMVAHISSYLFSARTHLNDLWNRKTGETTEFWTSDDVPGRKFGGEKPVYVLTAARTFSGAEEFSYNLKSLKRAVIVGETTGGGAHPVAPHRIDEHFQIAVPGSRAINPITKTNWEGAGVAPDVKVPAADALTTALKLLGEKTKP